MPPKIDKETEEKFIEMFTIMFLRYENNREKNNC
jgi:hypothetical protein